MTENQIAKTIVDAAIEVHRCLGGPGLLESVYEEALCYELQLRGLHVKRQVGFRVVYKELILDKRLVIDVLVNDLIILEIKAVSEPCPIA